MGASTLISDARSARPEDAERPEPSPHPKSRTMSGLVSSLSFFFGSFLVGILFTPFLVNQLGIKAYGLVPLSFSIAAYFALATQVISAIVNQKLIANEHDAKNFNHYFSVFFYICAALAAMLVMVIVVTRNSIVASLNVPEALGPSASLLLIASMINVALVLLSTPVSAVIYAVRGVDLINFARLLELLVRVGLIVALFKLWQASLDYVAYALMSGSAAAALAITFAALTQRHSLRLVYAEDALATLKMMFNLSIGVVLIQVGSLIFMNTELIIANMWFGPETSGQYAVSIQWAVVLRSLGLSVAATFVATAMRSFHHDPAGVKRVVVNSMFVLSAIMGLASGFVIGSSDTLLSVWLGSGSAARADILSVASMSVAFGVTAAPLYALCLASGRVLVPGVAICVAGVLYIVTFAALERGDGSGPLRLVAGCGAFYIGHLLVVSLPYAAKQIDASLRDFARPLISSVTWTVVAAVMARYCISEVRPTNFIGLAVCGVLITPAYTGAVVLTLPRHTREMFTVALRTIFRQFRWKR